jgi:membrane-associated protein
MNIIMWLIDFVLHIDKHLIEIINYWGALSYLIMFLIIFCETGLVVTPFLPGDSMLFVLGALGATGKINLGLILVLMMAAAVGGNIVNYSIGRYFGHKLLGSKSSKFIKKEYLEKTEAFYAKHGGKAIIISRFMPFIRTFAPFVAGIGEMNTFKFNIFNLIGGVSWTSLFLLAGYKFGNVPSVKHNLTLVIFGILFISVMPAVIAAIKARRV